MVIAVDAVGGDHFPEVPVKGAVKATQEDSKLEILLVGPKEMIQKELDSLDYDSERIRILHAPEIIAMNESPAAAVKTKKASSIAVGITAHRQGDCDAFVSVGNTGALLAASTFLLGKLEGVMRPTIAAPYPTLKGLSLLTDAGANLEVKPDMYLQFAKMSRILASEILDIDNPTVGLLNIGEEPEKGLEVHKEVYQILSNLESFVGNVEGKEILFGKADVYLSDGFCGNVLLKFGESIPGILQILLKKTMKEEGLDGETQKLVAGILSKAMDSFNYEHVGGIPFLGVDGICLVGHGGSSETAFKNMIANATRCVELEINKKIVASLNEKK